MFDFTSLHCVILDFLCLDYWKKKLTLSTVYLIIALDYVSFFKLTLNLIFFTSLVLTQKLVDFELANGLLAGSAHVLRRPLRSASSSDGL